MNLFPAPDPCPHCGRSDNTSLFICSGPKYTFGSIDIKGETKYQIWSGGTPICTCNDVSTAQILVDILNKVAG